MPLMPIRQELLINGAWTDFTGDTRGSNRIDIRRGFSSEQATLSAGSANFTLGDPTGIFNNRNPNSPYFGKVGRNTQYRCGLDTGVVSARILGMNTKGTITYDGSTIWTADKASLDITGDLDVRVDVEPDDWRGRAGTILAGKYEISGNQRSWTLITDPFGYAIFKWSNTGSLVTALQATSTVAVAASGRQSIRATIDVDNGAAGWTVTFYTAPTLSGTYTQLGAAVTGSGTTAIFNSTARLEVGTINNAAGPRGSLTTGLNSDPLVGKVYGMELRSGIGGSVVALMDATAQTEGTTSWVNGLNTWTLTGSTFLSSQDFRFWGELPNRGYRWDSTGSDVTAPAQAGDLIQRYTQGTKALRSPIYRNLSQYDNDGYWPMEDDFGATNIGAVDGRSGYKTNADFGTSVALPGTAGTLVFSDDTGYASGVAKTGQTSTGIAYVLFYFKFETAPTSTVTFFTTYFSGGTNYRADFKTDGASYTITIINQDGAVLATQVVSVGQPVTNWTAMRLLLDQDVGNVDYALGWYGIGGPVLYGISGSYVGIAGRATSWISYGFTGKFGFQLAHTVLSRFELPFVDNSFIKSTNGFIGESWSKRALRLAAEEKLNVFVEALTQYDGTEYGPFMGVQSTRKVIDLLQECADVAGGLLYAPRDKFGLAIRGNYAMQNRAAVTLDYSAKVLSGQLQPDEVGDFVRNDITVSRPNGSFSRAVKTSGPLNVSDPDVDPQGVGLYDVSLSRNTSTDDELDEQAYRELLIGTWDEMRYSGVQLETHRAPYVASASLTAAARGLDIGSRADITNLPVWLFPRTASLLVRGYSETLVNMTQTISLNTTPYGPYVTGVWGSPTTSLWGPASTTLKSAITSTATSMTIRTPDVYEPWSTTASYTIELAGEQILVPAAGAGARTLVSGFYEQVLTGVTRSVNGVIKGQVAGESVNLVNAGRWA